MKKLAIGLIALVILAGSMASPAAAQAPWGYMYLSTEGDAYNCNDGGASWDGGTKTIYVVMNSPGWAPGDNYGAIEFSVEYPSALFSTGKTSPDAPNALFFGGCSDGHCSMQMGTGGPIPVDPWTAVALEFLNFGAGNNLGFTLGPHDNPTPRAQGGPAWAYFDTEDPPIFIPQAGDGSQANPGWQQGFVMLNYDQASALAEPFPAQVFRNASATPWPSLDLGDPCARNKITPTEETSWGSLKAGF